MGFDSGFGNGFSFDVGSGAELGRMLTPSRMRFFAMPEAMRTLLYNIVTQRANAARGFYAGPVPRPGQDPCSLRAITIA